MSIIVALRSSIELERDHTARQQLSRPARFISYFQRELAGRVLVMQN